MTTPKQSSIISSMPLSAAVIGCGRNVPGKVGWAQGAAHANGYLDAFPGIALYGVDPNDENLQAFGKNHQLPKENLFHSTAELYQKVKPEMVSVVTWPGLHMEQVVEALASGVKMITCEKPLASDGSEIDQMMQSCQEAGARLAVAHQRRYEPRFELLRQLVQSGTVGKKATLTARIPDQWDMLSWTAHWFDMAGFIFDSIPVSVLGGIDHQGERRYGHAVENASVVFVEYASGEQGIFITGPDSSTGYSLSVEGPDGFLRLTDAGVCHFTNSGVIEHKALEMPDLAWKGYSLLFQDLNRAKENKEDFRCDISHGQWGTRTVFAAHQSAVAQKRVALPSTVKYASLEILQHPLVNVLESKLRIVLLADVHHWESDVNRSGRDGLIDALRSMGHEVLLVPMEERNVNSDDLDEKDLLVIYHTQRKSCETTKQLMRGWVKGNRPTLVSHCGIGAWDWEEYRQWIGRYWVWADEHADRASGHPMSSCVISVEKTSSLWSAPWKEGWLPVDEVYVRLGQAGAVEDIAWAHLQGDKYPWAWRSISQPNVAVFLPGHRADIWSLPLMRTALSSIIKVVI